MKQVLLAALALSLAGNAYAHTGDRIFPIMELSDADVAEIDIDDGSVDDWVAIMGEPTLTALDFNANRQFAPYDPSDLDFRIWMGWNDATNRIYVAVEKVDNVYVPYAGVGSPNFGGIWPWEADSALHFLVDGDHGGGETIYWVDDFPKEERVFQDNKESQYFMAVGDHLRDDGQHIDPMQNGISYGQDWFYSPPYAEGGGGVFGEDPTIVVTEFYVTPFDWLVWNDPSATKVSELSVGKTIGFAMSMIDFDTPGKTDYQGLYHLPQHTWGVYTPAEEFVDGLLVDGLGKVPEASAVEYSSWARIKASFKE